MFLKEMKFCGVYDDWLLAWEIVAIMASNSLRSYHYKCVEFRVLATISTMSRVLQ